MELAKKNIRITTEVDPDSIIVDISAHEEPTIPGIPTVGVLVMLDNGMKFTAATPLGTSAGSDEAIHLVDSIIEANPLTRKYRIISCSTKERHTASPPTLRRTRSARRTVNWQTFG